MLHTLILQSRLNSLCASDSNLAISRKNLSELIIVACTTPLILTSFGNTIYRFKEKLKVKKAILSLILFCIEFHSSAYEYRELKKTPAPLDREVNESALIKIELANTKEQQLWGLMQRKSLPPNQGMLFLYEPSQLISLWSFNCYIDLSVAFIDSAETIREIRLLKAYPEMMDPKRPVYVLSDLDKYPFNDPIRRFFHEHAVTSTLPCRYALEMPAGFFQEQKIEVGDILIWANRQKTLLKFRKNRDEL